MALRLDKGWRALATLLASLAGGPAWAEPFVEMQTSEGRIVFELHPGAAPQTVANFLDYVDAGFYAGTVVHRVIRGFMVQAGGYDEQMRHRPTREPIDNEAASCLKNRRGTVAMARSMAPRSTTSQFFINVEDNPHLNHVRPQAGYEGYCAFATVVEGMDVADRISRLPTGPGGVFAADVPLQPVLIAGATRVDGPLRFAEGDFATAASDGLHIAAPKTPSGSTMAKRAPSRRATP